MGLIKGLCTAALVAVLAACGSTAERNASDPLSFNEITAASAVLRTAGLLDDSVSVLQLVLREPSKQSHAATDSTSAARHGSALLFDQRSKLVSEVVVDLANNRVVNVEPRPGLLPSITQFDIRMAMRLIQSDSQWQDGIKRHRLEPSDVELLLMGVGTLDSRWNIPGHRYLRVTGTRRNPVSRFIAPVEGLVAVVDLTDARVVDVVDAEPAPVPFDSTPTLYPAAIPRSNSQWRNASGDYQIDGNTITWHGWKFRFAMHPREGLVLSDVAFARGNDPPRSILARASLAEMLVPYGDASSAWRFRSVFDVGEFGVGTTAATLIDGEDVPTGATRIDAVYANERGNPVVQRGVVGVYERDGGLRWRHEDRAERARELVMRFATTVGNYDYGFSWVFSPDGVLAMEIDLTGMMQVKGVQQPDPRVGTSVSPHLSAIYHQHFFSFRLDFDVVSRNNRIREVELTMQPVDSANPNGTGFVWHSTELTTERAAVRDGNRATSRFWVVEEAVPGDSAGRIAGERAGYVLAPGVLPELLAAPGSSLRKRGEFATHQLWTTLYNAREHYPSGDFPGQDLGTSGVQQFVANDDSLSGKDLVVWYTAGVTHVPRPEEWPIMPVSRMRFELRPTNFVRTGTDR